VRELTAAWAGLVESKNPWKYLDTSDRKPFKHLDFRLDTKGSSGDIEAYEVVALHKGDTVGRLSFSHFTDQGSVKTGMLAVPLEHQGRDVASELMLWLWHWCRDRNLSLEHSDRTDEGELWWRHFHKEHPKVAALIIRAEIVSEPDKRWW
jgi:GNAT superfamily N-acetyltransferase